MGRVSAVRRAVSCILLATPLCLGAAPGVGSRVDAKAQRVAGTYSDQRLAGIKVLTLPRTFLYDRNGALIARESWPPELKDFKQHAGDAFCCTSQTPSPPGSSGPPADCQLVVDGTDVRESFKGLHGPSGRALAYESLPKHEYLLVEYYATWCQPCVVGRKALETFFSSARKAEGYLWVSIDMSRLPKARKAAPARKRAPGALP